LCERGKREGVHRGYGGSKHAKTYGKDIMTRCDRSSAGECSPAEVRSLAALLGECRTGLTIPFTACGHLRLKGFHAFAGLGIPPRPALLLFRLKQWLRLRDALLRGGLLWLTCNGHPSYHKYQCCSSYPVAYQFHWRLLSKGKIGLPFRMMNELNLHCLLDRLQTGGQRLFCRRSQLWNGWSQRRQVAGPA
jgi:hypothetical protein